MDSIVEIETAEQVPRKKRKLDDLPAIRPFLTVAGHGIKLLVPFGSEETGNAFFKSWLNHNGKPLMAGICHIGPHWFEMMRPEVLEPRRWSRLTP